MAASSHLAHLPPISPGVIFRDYTLRKDDASMLEAANHMHVEISILDDFVAGRVIITDSFAAKLEAYSGTTKQFWLTLQANYNVSKALIP